LNEVKRNAFEFASPVRALVLAAIKARYAAISAAAAAYSAPVR